MPQSVHRATISVMGVTYELIDVPYPYVSAIYTCPCGKHAVRHAGEAGSPPPGWEEHVIDESEQVICPDCARRRAEGRGIARA